MPHLTIEYSENLAENIEISELVKVMHDSAASMRTASGRSQNKSFTQRILFNCRWRFIEYFVNVVLRIAPGRSDEVKKQAGEKLFSALKDFFDLFFQSSPIALSLEIQELDANLRWKDSNIREHMKKRSP